MVGSNAARLQLPPGDRRQATFNLEKLKLYTDGQASHPYREQQPKQSASADASFATASATARRAASSKSAAARTSAANSATAAAAPAALPSYEYINDDDEPVYEAEAILRTAIDADGKWYLVKWRGWPVSEATWQLAKDMHGAQSLVREYETRHRQSEESGVQPMDEEATAVKVCYEPAPTLAAAILSHPRPQSSWRYDSRQLLQRLRSTYSITTSQPTLTHERKQHPQPAC